LELRTEVLAEAAPQLLEDAPRALHVDLARYLHGDVVAVVAAAQRATERIGLLVGAWLPHSARLAGSRTHHALLLHLLREVLRPAAQRLERTALRIDGTVGVALAELALRVAHGLAGLPELLAHVALALLPLLPRLLTGLLAEAALAQLLHQLV